MTASASSSTSDRVWWSHGRVPSAIADSLASQRRAIARWVVPATDPAAAPLCRMAEPMTFSPLIVDGGDCTVVMCVRKPATTGMQAPAVIQGKSALSPGTGSRARVHRSVREEDHDAQQRRQESRDMGGALLAVVLGLAVAGPAGRGSVAGTGIDAPTGHPAAISQELVGDVEAGAEAWQALGFRCQRCHGAKAGGAGTNFAAGLLGAWSDSQRDRYQSS